MGDAAVDPVPIQPRLPIQRAPRTLLRGLSDKTKADYYKVLLRAYGPFGPVPDAVPADLDKWPESSRRILRAAIKAYWTYPPATFTVEWGGGDSPETGENIAVQIPILREQKRKMQFPTEAEMVAFETAAQQLKPRFSSLLLLLTRMGLRADELLSLTREQVERGLATGELFFMRKGGQEGSLPIAHVRGTLETLLGIPAANPHSAEKVVKIGPAPVKWNVIGEILGSKAGLQDTKHPTGTRYNLLLRLVKKAAKLAGLDPQKWTPHKLRHGFATRMNRDGAPAATIQKALGHKNLLTTQKYIHADVSDVDKFMRR